MGILLLAVALRQFSLYWPRALSPDSANSWTLQQLLPLLLVMLLATVIGFVVGYLLGWRKKGASGAENLEDALNYLEKTTQDAWAASVELLKKLGFSPRPYEAVQTSDEEPPHGGARSGFRGWVSNYLGDGESPGRRGPIAKRLRKIKHDVKYVTQNVGDAIPYVTKADMKKRKEQGIIIGDIKKDVYDDQQEDTLPGSQHTPRDSASGRPTISRHRRDEHRREAQDGSAREVVRRQAASSIGVEIVDMYNRAVTDPFERERFRDKYTPVRVGTVNAVERRQNPTIEAAYREATDGDFFAYHVGGEEYVVVPSLGLTIESVGYTAGALGEVFRDTRGHDPQCFYSNYRVQRPAIFRRDGDRWELRSPGALELGPGD